MLASRAAASVAAAPRLLLLPLLLLPSVLALLPPAGATLDTDQVALRPSIRMLRATSPRRDALHEVPADVSYIDEELGVMMDPMVVRALLQLLSTSEQSPRQAQLPLPLYPRLPLLPEAARLPHKRDDNQNLIGKNCRPAQGRKKSVGPTWLGSRDAVMRRLGYMLGGNLDQDMNEVLQK
ncbi:uncharacterized protein [Panulirus ornatus]|uniref:uncharacterized protein isoform X2 n=1 Tax=Panulirus ornatus TaxID=150431 RepID=UPI003A8C35B6